MKKVLFICLLFTNVAVNAAVIDFEDLGVVSGGQYNSLDHEVITSGGYDFVNGPSSTFPDLHFPNDNPRTFESSTELLSHGDVIMSRSGGGSFSLDSFDFGAIFGEVATFSVVANLLGGGSATEIFYLDGDSTTSEFFTLNASFNNIVSAEWLMVGGVGGLFNLDNISVSNESVSAVPVPAALFMFAPALLGFFGLRRKAKS